MGCTSSHFTTDGNGRLFRVHNVDDQGNRLSSGRLKVTERDLIYYQANNEPVHWPLRCLRRYGFDTDLFSFESGRRCPTGQGIYAFSCKNAEDLFVVVQEATRDEQSHSNHFLPQTVVPVSSRPISAYTEPHEINHDPILNNTTVTHPPELLHGSECNPCAALPLQESAEHLYVNTNVEEHNYMNTEAYCDKKGDSVLIDFLDIPENVSSEAADVPRSLQDLDIEMDELNLNLLGYSRVSDVRPVSREISNVITTNSVPPTVRSTSWSCATKPKLAQTNGHAWNLSLDETTCVVKNDQSSSVNAASKKVHHKQMNYIVLDSARSADSSAAINGFPSPAATTSPFTLVSLPESPTRSCVGYAQIDFNKTNALQHMSTTCRNDNKDGIRKTRHNSTINEV